MPLLEKIVVQDYRNIALAELEFSPNVNCISGNNGEGKTNLMDAIYYLSMCKSAFAASDRYNYRYGTQQFALAGEYLMKNGLRAKFAICVSPEGKKFRKDDKPYPRVSEHIGELPIVMVSPSDISMVSEAGEERRRFLNAVLSQMDAEYLADVQQYNRLLTLRNKMLKEQNPDAELLTVFDIRMSSYADRIYSKRKAFVEELSPVVSQFYKALSGGQEEVSVAYCSDIEKAPLSELLARGRERDIALKFTGSGVQRDDLDFVMDGHPIRRCGSQGQQKSFLVSLKFAQYELMKKAYGFAPMLLLDDVFDKLDMNRISNLLALVAGAEFGQIFISDSNKVRMSSIVDGITSDSAYFETVNGSFTRQ